MYKTTRIYTISQNLFKMILGFINVKIKNGPLTLLIITRIERMKREREREREREKGPKRDLEEDFIKSPIFILQN